jgi:membrane protein DedA with SNARE-associated domain
MNIKLVAKRILPLVYFLAVSLPHYPVSDWIDHTFLIPYGFQVVQRFGDILSILLFVIILALGFKVFQVYHKYAVRHFLIWLLLLILMVAADRILIVNNIERIHFPQYAVLSLILGWSLRNEMLIFFTSSFAGFVDEFLQYVMDPNRGNYLDFNDIVFNMLGAALGVALLMSLRTPLTKEIQKYEKRFWMIFETIIAALAIIVMLTLVLNRFVLVAEQVKPRTILSMVDGKLSFIMSFERHDQFWQRSPAHGKAFHVLSPFEGLSILFLLSAFTGWWTKWLKRNQRGILKR